MGICGCAVWVMAPMHRTAAEADTGHLAEHRSGSHLKVTSCQFTNRLPAVLAADPRQTDIRRQGMSGSAVSVLTAGPPCLGAQKDRRIFARAAMVAG
jgi:hypothetical protein